MKIIQKPALVLTSYKHEVLCKYSLVYLQYYNVNDTLGEPGPPPPRAQSKHVA